MTSTFFRGLSGSDVSVFFILRFRICFEENYDEVDGRSSSFSFWLLQALLLQPIFFYPCCLFFSGTDRASLGLTTTFFLALIFFLLLYSSPFFFFTIGLTVNLVCFHHLFLDMKTIEDSIARTLNFWAPLSNQNIRIIRSIHSVKGAMEQLHFIATKITKNFSQQHDCAMNNTRKIPYFLACQKICRTYINILKRKNRQNGQIIHQKVYCFK